MLVEDSRRLSSAREKLEMPMALVLPDLRVASIAL